MLFYHESYSCIGESMKKHLILSIIVIASLFAVLPVSLSSYPTITISPSGGTNDTIMVRDAILGLDDGGTVYFEPGTYHLHLEINYGDVMSPFHGFNKSFSLVGAGQGVTILNGDITGDGNGDLNIFDFRYMGDDVVTITGFTFTNGREYSGGAIYNYDASMAIFDCTFENNVATGYGGAVSIVDNFDDNRYSLDNCTFVGNSADDNGGGLSLNTASPTITNCLFEGNDADDNGGGIHICNPSYPLIANCVFVNNEAGEQGGAVFNGEESGATIYNCIFSDNHAGVASPTAIHKGHGGAMLNASTSSPKVYNCLFESNSALWAGGGMANHKESAPVVVNCVFVENYVRGGTNSNASNIVNIVGNGSMPTSVGGGGMYSGFNSEPVVTNCTFTHNEVPYYSYSGSYDGRNGGGIKNNDGSKASFTNCIVWGNFPNDVLNADGNMSTFEYSNIGGGFTGEGNIDANPLFVNAPTDVSLRQGSPCIDAGTNTSGPQYGNVTDDYTGVMRPQRMGYDIGAYEYVFPAWSPVSIMPLARTQLAHVLEEWGSLSEQLPEEPTDEMAELIERIQAYMQNATGLANPVYASGQLSKAAETMEQLAALLV